MKSQSILFWVLTVFFLVSALVYTFMNIIAGSQEWVGSVGMLLSAVLAGFLAFYFRRVHVAQGGVLPEDNLNAQIDDGDPEIGYFSPWSWWPICLAFGFAVVVLGLAVGFWLTFIGIGFVVVFLIGWVFEDYRGYYAR